LMLVHVRVDKFEAGTVLVDGDFKVGGKLTWRIPGDHAAPDNEGAVGRRALYCRKYPTTVRCAVAGGIIRREIAKVREQSIVESWIGQADIVERSIVAGEL